jgi:hypothetical protein
MVTHKLIRVFQEHVGEFRKLGKELDLSIRLSSGTFTWKEYYFEGTEENMFLFKLRWPHGYGASWLNDGC